jgi:tRNA pseudouridine13 synthase
VWYSRPSRQLTNIRFTDFLVFEVDQERDVLHLTSIDKPDGSLKPQKKSKAPNVTAPPAIDIDKMTTPASDNGENMVPPIRDSAPDEVGSHSMFPTIATSGAPSKVDTSTTSSSQEMTWTDHMTATLTPLLPSSTIEQLKEMFLQGPEAPLVSDSGWGGRKPSVLVENDTAAVDSDGGAPTPIPVLSSSSHQHDREGRGRGRGRGGRGTRGGRGRGRFDNDSTRPGKREDLRRVVSDVSPVFQCSRCVASPPCIDGFAECPLSPLINLCRWFLISANVK